jgi:hypothetical protein
MPVIDPSELIGCTFLMDKEDGQQHRAHILKVVDDEEICKRLDDHERELNRQRGHIKFVCSVNDDTYKEILTYNEDGEMEISARLYVDRMMVTYLQLYGEKPRKTKTPLEQNDHPEMDDSPFLGQDETQRLLYVTCFSQYFAHKGSDKICMKMKDLLAIELLRARIGVQKVTRMMDFFRVMH